MRTPLESGQAARLAALSATLDPATGLATDASVATLGASCLGVMGSAVAGRTRVWTIGDSLTADPNVNFRGELQQLLRRSRGNVSFVGHATGAEWPRYLLADFEHSGHSGDKIEDVTARVVANGATAGVGTGSGVLAIVKIGTNNLLNSESAATMQGKIATLVSTMQTAFPALAILLVAPDPLWSPVATYATKNAVRTTYLPLLSALAASAGCGYVEPHAAYPLTDEDYAIFAGSTRDGIHSQLPGQKKIARGIYDAAQSYLALPSGPPMPRIATKRLAQASMYLATNASGTASTAAYDAAHYPVGGTGSFMWLYRHYPVSVDAGLVPMIQYGSLADGVAVIQNGSSITLYNAGNPIVGFDPNTPANVTSLAKMIQTAAWNWIAILGDATEQTLSIWTAQADSSGIVRGGQRAVAGPAVNWNFAASKVMNLGKGVGYGGNNPIGYLDNLIIGVGSGVPTRKTFRPFFEAWAAEGITPPGATKHHRFDENTGTSAADVFGGQAMTLTSAANWGTSSLYAIEL